jgi:LysM repeat protein
MKRTALLIAFVISFFCAFAQKKIIVRGYYPNLFIQHKIVSGETLFSIAKVYNLSIAQIVKQNDGLNENAILAIGKVMKIPVDPKNFTQDGQNADNEILIPLHHVVQNGENLYYISLLYGKVKANFLREWNGLNSNVIQQGQKLIIGYLKVDKTKSAEAVERTIIETDTNDSGYGFTTEEKKKDNPKPVDIKTESIPVAVINGADDEGFFVNQFPTKGNNIFKAGECATFKTTSGWTDRKYYILINDITPGTIVRITAANNKSICAKVLGVLPEMKENHNLLLRISNAAASVLGVTETKFSVKVAYYD